MIEMPPPPLYAYPAHTGAAYPNYTNVYAKNAFNSSPDNQLNSNTESSAQGQINEMLSYASNVSRDGAPMMGFGNFPGINTLPSRISGHYEGDGEYNPAMPNNFGYMLNDPFREQDLRQAIEKKLPAMPQEHNSNAPVMQRKQKPKTPRKNATPNVKKTTNVATPKQAASGGRFGKMVSKIESEALISGPNGYNDNSNTGMTFINNDSGNAYSHSNSLDFGNTSYDIIGGVDMLGLAQANPTMTSPISLSGSPFNINSSNNGTLPALTTQFGHVSAAPMIASPDEYGGSYYDSNGAHTAVTPTVNNFAFDSSTAKNLQLTHFPSISSSFASIQASQSNEAVPSIEQGGLINFYVEEAWDAGAYEEQMPLDPYANLDLNLGDLDNSYFN